MRSQRLGAMREMKPPERGRPRTQASEVANGTAAAAGLAALSGCVAHAHGAQSNNASPSRQCKQNARQCDPRTTHPKYPTSSSWTPMFHSESHASTWQMILGFSALPDQVRPGPSENSHADVPRQATASAAAASRRARGMAIGWHPRPCGARGCLGMLVRASAHHARSACCGRDAVCCAVSLAPAHGEPKRAPHLLITFASSYA